MNKPCHCGAYGVAGKHTQACREGRPMHYRFLGAYAMKNWRDAAKKAAS